MPHVTLHFLPHKKTGKYTKIPISENMSPPIQTQAKLYQNTSSPKKTKGRKPKIVDRIVKNTGAMRSANPFIYRTKSARPGCCFFAS